MTGRVHSAAPLDSLVSAESPTGMIAVRCSNGVLSVLGLLCAVLLVGMKMAGRFCASTAMSCQGTI